MKLYKVEYGLTARVGNARVEQVKIEWAGTQADAKAAKIRLLAGDGYDVEVSQVEVPTDKPGLLAWLNEHVAGDK